MRKLWAVMRRDLLKMMRNPLALLASIMMPVLYLVIIGNTFEGQLKHLPVAAVVEDHGKYGRRVMEQLQALAVGPKTIDVFYLDDPQAALQAVRHGIYKAAIVVPPDFTHKIEEGLVGEVGMFTDNVDVVSSGDLEQLLQDAIGSIRDDFVSARRPVLNQIVLRPAELFTTVDYDRSLIPGVIVMALFMGSLSSGIFNWVMDKFMGVTESYLVTPLTRWEIAGGMLASSVIITSIAAITVLVLGLLVTGGFAIGGPAAAALLVLIIIIAGTGLLAMTFALLGRASHPRVVGVCAGFLNVILFFPSGAIYPVESFPPWLQTFARYNPETHAVSALKSVLFKGADLVAISNDMAFLTVFMFVMLILASFSFKRTL